MKPAQVLPAVLIVIDLAAAGVYACQGNVRQTAYWVAAAVITAAVTF